MDILYQQNSFYTSKKKKYEKKKIAHLFLKDWALNLQRDGSQMILVLIFLEVLHSAEGT